MWKSAVVLGTALLSGCGGGGSGSGTESDDGISRGSERVDLQVKTVNACGLESAYTDFELLIYDDEGSITDRFSPNSSGQARALVQDKLVNLGLVLGPADAETPLDVIVLNQVPADNLGLYYVRTNGTDGCDCDTVDVELTPTDGTVGGISAPYRTTSLSFPADTETYGQTSLCRTADDLPIGMLVGYKDRDNDRILYRYLANPASSITGEKVEIDIFASGTPGTPLPVTGDGPMEVEVSYLVDGLHPLSIRAPTEDVLHVFKASGNVGLRNVSATSDEVMTSARFTRGGWVVELPLSDTDTDVHIEKPSLDPNTLASALESAGDDYPLTNLDGDFLDTYRSFVLPGVRDFNWTIITPLDGNKPVSYELPSEYYDNSGAYPGTLLVETYSMEMLDDVDGLQEFYGSLWRRRLLDFAPVPEKPRGQRQAVIVSTL